MEEFTLEKYLANPERKVVTGGGEPVRIVCHYVKGSTWPIVGIVQVSDYVEVPMCYTKNGRLGDNEPDSESDLFFVPVKHEGWVNIFRSDEGKVRMSGVYPTKITAQSAGAPINGFVATTRIEWTE